LAIKWTVSSEQVHHSVATLTGPSPKDGGMELLLEAFEFVRSNKQTGTMTITFGLGGAIRLLRFDQSEPIPFPIDEPFPPVTPN
jgi:hypothetical protein